MEKTPEPKFKKDDDAVVIKAGFCSPFPKDEEITIIDHLGWIETEKEHLYLAESKIDCEQIGEVYESDLEAK